MSSINTIVLVLKKGGDYSYSDVDILCHHLRKNYPSNVPLRIICINDIFSEEVVLSTCHFIPMRFKWKGWWSKLNLFSPALEQFRPFLYLDLDTAVVRDYSQIFTLFNATDFTCLRDFYHPERLASGIMWIGKENPKVEFIWNRWMENPDYFQKTYRGDQEFIKGMVKVPDKYFQDSTHIICSFKPKGQWLFSLPENVSIVCFHGNPRPRRAISVEWVNHYFKGL